MNIRNILSPIVASESALKHAKSNEAKIIQAEVGVVDIDGGSTFKCRVRTQNYSPNRGSQLSNRQLLYGSGRRRRLRILVPILNSGGYRIATDSLEKNGNTIVLSAANLAGYEVSHYSIEGLTGAIFPNPYEGLHSLSALVGLAHVTISDSFSHQRGNGCSLTACAQVKSFPKIIYVKLCAPHDV